MCCSEVFTAKTPSDGFLSKFSLRKILLRPRPIVRADALCARKTIRKKPVEPRSCAKLFVDRRSGSRLRIMRVRITRSRPDGGKGFLSFFRMLSRAYMRARSRSYVQYFYYNIRLIVLCTFILYAIFLLLFSIFSSFYAPFPCSRRRIFSAHNIQVLATISGLRSR